MGDNMKILTVVKRRRHREKFDEKKLYASIYSACMSAGYTESNCEQIAERISKKVESIIKKKRSIKSIEISRIVFVELETINKRLAFFYEQHLPNLRRL